MGWEIHLNSFALVENYEKEMCLGFGYCNYEMSEM